MSNYNPEPGADQLRKLGYKTRAERKNFREMRDGTDIMWSTRNQPANDNPWRKILNQMEEGKYTPRSPSEIRRYERLHQQAAERDAELAAQHEEHLAQLKREADPEYLKAKEVYAAHLNGYEPTTPSEHKYVAKATRALSDGDYAAMCSYLISASDERSERLERELRDVRERQSDATLSMYAKEAEKARLDQARVMPTMEDNVPDQQVTE